MTSSIRTPSANTTIVTFVGVTKSRKGISAQLPTVPVVDIKYFGQYFYSILNNDAFNLEVLPLHVSCLVELKLTTGYIFRSFSAQMFAAGYFTSLLFFFFAELFYLAHKLTDMYPDTAVRNM